MQALTKIMPKSYSSQPNVKFNLFRESTSDYKRYRPSYPKCLYELFTIPRSDNSKGNATYYYDNLPYIYYDTVSVIGVDMGCGSGQATVQLANYVCDFVYGIEPSKGTSCVFHGI